MKLFIIGNGFDLGHDLETRYWDFRCFLEEHYERFLRNFEEKYSLGGEGLKTYLWDDFEFNLAKIAEDILIEDMYQSTDLGLESGNIGIEDTLNYHFSNEFRYIEDLTIYLKEWIEVVGQEISGLKRKTTLIDKRFHDEFINFNYTTTLEDVYDIPEENVLHIHGIVNSEENLVLGHSDSARIDYYLDKVSFYRNNFDEQSAPIYNALADYCSKTYKDVEKYMHRLFSVNFDTVEKVIVIGHSLGDVDLPYFIEINERITEDIEWHIYYYDENQIDMFREKLNQLGIAEQRVKFIPCDNFYNAPSLEQAL